MKITQTNDNELSIHTSGIGSVIAGSILLIVGLGVIVFPFVQTADWWVSLIGVGICIVGGLVVFTAATVTTTLRRQGASTISEKRLVGGRTKDASFESSQIDHIKLDSHTEYSSSSSSSDRAGDRRRERVSVVLAVLNDATEVTLASKRSNANGGMSINGIGLSAISKAPLANEAKQIADFFGVPLKTGLQDASLQDVVGAAQTMFGHNTPPVVPVSPAPTIPQVPTVPPVPTSAPNPAAPTESQKTSL